MSKLDEWNCSRYWDITTVDGENYYYRIIRGNDAEVAKIAFVPMDPDKNTNDLENLIRVVDIPNDTDELVSYSLAHGEIKQRKFSIDNKKYTNFRLYTAVNFNISYSFTASLALIMKSWESMPFFSVLGTAILAYNLFTYLGVPKILDNVEKTMNEIYKEEYEKEVVERKAKIKEYNETLPTLYGLEAINELHKTVLQITEKKNESTVSQDDVNTSNLEDTDTKELDDGDLITIEEYREENNQDTIK